MRRIGLLGGMSWESTSVYYKRINEEVRRIRGGLISADLAMISLNFDEVVQLQKKGDWNSAASMLSNAALNLQASGAQAIIICTNTMHKLFDEVQSSVSVPVLHIADTVGCAIQQKSFRRPLLLATRYTMEQAFYRDRIADAYGLDIFVPEKEDRDFVHDVIFDEICQGVLSETSRQGYIDIIAKGIDAGADSVIFGCTEIGLLVSQDEITLPAFDSTILHADAAVGFALN